MNVLDLFSGIGGFSLGLERAGMRTVAFCEIDPYCRAVLAKHWPYVPCFKDIRELTAARLATDGIAVDVICGGFPCQDISVAGKGAGLSGARSGLWAEYARLVGEVRPRYVIVENVSALRSRGLERVLGDLATLGYDSEWHCIPASAIGAPHIRDRIWIIAYARGEQLWDESGRWCRPSGSGSTELADDGCAQYVAHTHDAERWPEREARGAHREQLLFQGKESPIGSAGRGTSMANANGQGKLQPRGPLIEIWRWIGDGGDAGDTDSTGLSVSGPQGQQSGRSTAAADWWAVEPDVGRMAHGVPARVDRLKCLGNAVVPQVVETIGRAIMKCAHTSFSNGSPEKHE